MKSFILFSAIVFLSLNSYGQLSLAVQAGTNIGMGRFNSINNMEGSPLKEKKDPKAGLIAGLIMQMQFGKFAFRPELNFIQKGSKNKFYLPNDSTGSSFTKKFAFNYLELPLNVVYDLSLGKAGKIFFGLGPSFAFGLGGKIETYTATSPNGFTDKIKFDGDEQKADDDYHLKKVDIGINFLAGFQMKMGLFVKAGYTYGFTDIDPNIDNLFIGNYERSYKNRGVSICIGYMLQGLKVPVHWHLPKHPKIVR